MIRLAYFGEWLAGHKGFTGMESMELSDSHKGNSQGIRLAAVITDSSLSLETFLQQLRKSWCCAFSTLFQVQF